MTDPQDPRVRRNHRDEWARVDARRTPPPWLLWVAAFVVIVALLVWIGGAR